MYKKILIPVDGSEVSAQAAKDAIAFAKSIGASIVAVHITQPLSSIVGFDGMSASYAISDDEYEKVAVKEAASFFLPLEELATEQGVDIKNAILTSYSISDGIVDAVKEHGCDLIYMSSHGRSGLSRWLLGSVTSRVTTVAPVSVLVHRPAELKE